MLRSSVSGCRLRLGKSIDCPVKRSGSMAVGQGRQRRSTMVRRSHLNWQTTGALKFTAMGQEGSVGNRRPRLRLFPRMNGVCMTCMGTCGSGAKMTGIVIYEGAPSDGSAWVEIDRKSARKLLRGGSWVNGPVYCRSACRYFSSRGIRYNFIGFRVCCVPP